MKIRENVLGRIIPDEEEQVKLDRAVAELIESVNGIAEKLKVELIPQLVGSIAKGTHLKSPDIDLFLKFPTNRTKDEIGEIARAIGKAILENPEERFAEHPYISGHWYGFRTDLVPCYNVVSGSGKISAVDRTPFHTEFVIGHLKPEQRDEVRLLKQFMKGVETYGAEAKVQGFSGYLCELLILNYDSFEKVIASARKWKLPMVLWLDQQNGKDFEEPFVFVDPVDPARNVASAVSTEKLQLFIEACRAFKRNPSEKFFFPPQLEPWDEAKMIEMIDKHPGTVLTELPGIEAVDDILWPQLRKTGRSIFEILEREGFEPIKVSLSSEQQMNLIMIDCKTSQLSPTFIHQGPPERSSEAQNFLNKWNSKGVSEPSLKKGRWQVEVRREWRTPKELLTERFDSVGVGKGFRQIEAPIIAAGKELLNPKYRKALTGHFDMRKPWER